MILNVLATLPYGDDWRISFNTETLRTDFRPVGDDRDGEVFALAMPEDMFAKAKQGTSRDGVSDSLWTPLCEAIFHHYQAQGG